MIDSVFTIAGDFSRFTLFNFFCVVNQKYQKLKNISFWFATRKKLNSVNRENPPTIIKTELIIETTLFLWRILKVILLFY